MIRRYLAERFHLLVYAPVALTLAFAAGSGRMTPAALAALAADAVFALVLLLHFRAWDDLADRRADAAAHPDRVLVQAKSVAPVVGLAIVAGAVALAIALLPDRSGIAALGLLALQGVFAVWYATRGARTAAGDALLLSKYPAILLIVAGDRAASAPAPIALAAVLTFAAACAYEAWHDPSAFSFGGHS